MRYRVYGHVLASTCDLPELMVAGDGPADIAIAVTPDPPPPARVEPDACAVADEDRPWLTVARLPGGFLLRFGRSAAFSVSADASRILVHGAGPSLADTVQHLLIDQVVPLALAHRGALVVHSSALVVDGSPIALIGPSGAGKSTLAAGLVQAGCALIADDALVVEPVRDDAGGARALAHPAYASLRVWPDVLPAVAAVRHAPMVAAYTEKRRVAPWPGGFVREPRALRRMYVIEDEESPEPVVTPMSKRAAAMALVTHSYVLDTSDAGRLSRQLRIACDVLDAVDVRVISFPRQLERLTAVAAAIRRDLAA